MFVFSNVIKPQGLEPLQFPTKFRSHSPIPGKQDELTTNTARTQLLINSGALPWADWAAEFRGKMPQELKDLVDEAAAASTSSDHRDAIRERLKQLADLFRLSRYRPSPLGSFLVDEETPRRGGRALIKELERRGRGGRPGGRGGRAGDVYAVFATESGTPADKARTDPYPEVIWVSTKDLTRDPGFLEDRAVKYLPEQNLLQINADFRVFTDMIDRFAKLYPKVPGARATIEEVVREWFEQNLIETALAGC